MTMFKSKGLGIIVVFSLGMVLLTGNVGVLIAERLPIVYFNLAWQLVAQYVILRVIIKNKL